MKFTFKSVGKRPQCACSSCHSGGKREIKYINEHGDALVLSVKLNEDARLTLSINDEDEFGEEHEINADEVFPGYLQYITQKIKSENK